VFALATVQTCIIDLIRGSFRYASGKYWDALAKDLKPIHTAVNADAAATALEELEDTRGQRYPALIRLWRNAWSEFIAFLDYDIEIRRVICSTNAIESLERPLPPSRQGPRALPHRAGRDEVPLPGHPLSGPKGTGQTRWAMRCKPALNAFAITFADRTPAAESR
jgi:putative transposase